MIPKIIHYCWFGNGEKSELEKKCIVSWKLNLPDYQIIEWNENNFDIKCNSYVREAYEEKKFAFVSDYARLKVLQQYGGVYMDLDVEVKKSLDEFLDYSAVFGFESSDRIATAIFMAEKNNILINEWMKTYENRHFRIRKKKYDMTPNVKQITRLLTQLGLKKDNTSQNLVGNVAVYEKSFFCPYGIGDDKQQKFKGSYTVHWCEGSWVMGKTKAKHYTVVLAKKILGNRYEKVRMVINKCLKLD